MSKCFGFLPGHSEICYLFSLREFQLVVRIDIVCLVDSHFCRKHLQCKCASKGAPAVQKKGDYATQLARLQWQLLDPRQMSELMLVASMLHDIFCTYVLITAAFPTGYCRLTQVSFPCQRFPPMLRFVKKENKKLTSH